MGLFGKKEKATFYKFLVIESCVPSMVKSVIGCTVVGKKQKTTYKDFFMINYTADEVLSFEMVNPPVGFASFLSKLKQKVGISNVPAVGSRIL